MLLLNLVTQYPPAIRSMHFQNNLSFTIRSNVLKNSQCDVWILSFFLNKVCGVSITTPRTSHHRKKVTCKLAFQLGFATTRELRELLSGRLLWFKKNHSHLSNEMKNESRSTMWTNSGRGSVTIYFPVHSTILWRRWQVLALGTYLVISWLTDKSAS